MFDPNATATEERELPVADQEVDVPRDENGDELEGVTHDEVLLDLANRMRPLLNELIAEEEKHFNAMDKVRKRRQKIEKAVRSLEMDNVPPSKVKPTVVAPESTEWSPSVEMREKVLNAYREAGEEGLTVSEAVKVTGYSSSAVDKSIRFMRGKELRLAGRRNNGALYKLYNKNNQEKRTDGE